MITIMKPIIAIIKMKNMITAKIIITIMIIAIIIIIIAIIMIIVITKEVTTCYVVIYVIRKMAVAIFDNDFQCIFHHILIAR